MVHCLLDWIFLRFALPYAKKRGLIKEQSAALVMQYDGILQVLHEDKLKNKPGVYGFLAMDHTGKQSAGFILGKNTVESEGGRHILKLLHDSNHLRIFRLTLSQEETGLYIQYLRSRQEGCGDPVPGKIDQWCKAREGCANIFNEPIGLHASATVLFDHKGE